MRSHIVCAGGMIVALAIPGTAVAQELGLDLTHEGPNLQPSLAIVTVAVSEDDVELAAPVEQALAEIATASGLFSRIFSGDPLREVQPADGTLAQNCRESSCLTALSHRLGVDRVLIAVLDSGELRTLAFDWAGAILVETALDGDGLGTANLALRLEPSVAPLLRKLSTPLGELVVRTNVEWAQIRWGSRLVGEGRSFQGAVPAGRHPVRITSGGYRPREETVTLAPAGKAELDAELEGEGDGDGERSRAPVAEDEKDELLEEAFDPKGPPVKPLWQRPALYTALAGAVVLAVGLAFGGAANSVGSRIQDPNGDGVVEGVTRAEVLAARRDVVLANVLGTVGGLGLGVGVGWLIFDVKTGVQLRGNF
jgi:hypothetical protein